MGNFWDWMFGPIKEFLSWCWKMIRNAFKSGTVLESADNIFQSIAMWFAKTMGEPRIYTPGKDDTWAWVCGALALYLLGIAIVRTIRQRKAHVHIRWQAIVWWIIIILAVVELIWNTLGALIVVIFGWFLIRLFNTVIKMITGTGKEMIGAVIAMIPPVAVLFVLLRAAQISAFLY